MALVVRTNQLFKIEPESAPCRSSTGLAYLNRWGGLEIFDDLPLVPPDKKNHD
jgi:hypothetical protein